MGKITEKEINKLVYEYTPLEFEDTIGFTTEQMAKVNKWIDEAFKAGFRQAIDVI